MGTISRILQKITSRMIQFGMRGESPWAIADFNTKPTSAGTPVSESNSLDVTAVWACIRIISNMLAMLPLHVYRRLEPRGKNKALGHPLYRLLHTQSNPDLNAFQWRSLMSVHQNLWGVGISEIQFDGAGNPVALWPIPPWRVVQKRTESKQLFYRVLLDNGQYRDIQPYKCLVFPGLQLWGDEWLSPIGVHRETIGYSKALSEYGSKTFGQGINPAAILTHPGKLKETSEEALRKKYKPYEGLGNAHRLMLLEDGMKFERVGLPPEDAQYLQSRQFSVAEIARIYNVPLHLLQLQEKSTSWGTGIEEMNLGFIQFTLQPYITQWEQEISVKLFNDEDTEFFAEFLLSALMRGKMSERYSAYATGRQWGWMSVNDIRELENMNPIDDGDIYLIPANMVPADKVGEVQENQPAEQTTEEAE